MADVCIERKIRNFVDLTAGNNGDADGKHIYVTERAVLNKQHEKAYDALKIKPEKQKLPKDAAKARELTAWMCQNFYDIRTFGAVMTTEVNCGQVRGPIQFSLGRSLDPIFAQEHAVTRCAVTTEREAEAQQGDNRTMGRKFTVPYGLYRVHGFINPFLAQQTGFSQSDLDLFKQALNQMFEFDRSAARGQMAPRRCIAFRHDSALGNARADQLFSRVRVALSQTCAAENKPPRSYDDYGVELDDASLPHGISVEEWITA